MLQKDKEFDLMVRSMMEDAVEEVPSGVWEAVSGSLPAAAPRRRVLPLWGRVAAGVAVAASVALGVFLGFRNNSNPDISKPVAIVRDNGSASGEKLLADQIETENRAVTAAVATVPKTVSEPRPDIRPLPREDSGQAGMEPETNAESNPASAPQTEEVPQTKVIPQVAEEPQTKEEPQPKEEPQAESAAPAGPDPFALMEWEDRQRQEKGRASLTVDGVFATNGDPQVRVSGPLTRPKNYIQPSHTEITEVSTKSTYGIPISFGVGVRLPLWNRFSLGTGLTYSMMDRVFNGIYVPVENGVVGTTISSDIRHSVHYAGIPLHLYYDVIGGNRMRFYVYAGGSVEKALLNRYHVPSSSGTINYNESVKHLMGGVGGGIGFEFLLTDYLGLYFDPSVRYYFGKGQPVSIRTRQPLMMNFEVGLRIGL